MSEKNEPAKSTQSQDGEQSQPHYQQYQYSNVFRQLFATLEAEHRKLQELEQRRLKLTQEMQSLREMLQQENRRLRQSSPSGTYDASFNINRSKTMPSSTSVSRGAAPPAPPAPPPTPPALPVLSGASTSISTRKLLPPNIAGFRPSLQNQEQKNMNNNQKRKPNQNQTNRKLSKTVRNFTRNVSAMGNEMLGSRNIVNWDNELEPRTQEELDEILASLPTLFNLIDRHLVQDPSSDYLDILMASRNSDVISLPPNPPPSESEFYNMQQSSPDIITSDSENDDDDEKTTMDLDKSSMGGFGHLELIHPLNPPHSSFYMPLTNLSTTVENLDDMVPNLLPIPQISMTNSDTLTSSVWRMPITSDLSNSMPISSSLNNQNQGAEEDDNRPNKKEESKILD